MTTNQEGVHTAIRAATGTTLDYNSDWSTLFDQAGIDAGQFNERLLAWINLVLVASYASLPAAQQAFAEDQGFANWSSMNTIAGLGGPAPVGSPIGLLLILTEAA